MIIGIDGNEANVKRRVGIGQYAFELLWQFYESQKSSFDSAQDKNIKYQIYLKDKPREDLPEESENWKYRVIGPKRLWTQFALPFNLYLSRPRPDVFFSPTHYAPRFSPISRVISIMDISYIQYPALFKKSDLYQLKSWTAYSVRNAKKVLTISQASKDDIIKVYQAPEDKVVVTYPGIKMTSSKFNPSINSGLTLSGVERVKVQSSKLLKEKYRIKGDYVLFVGTLQPRKNIVRLIEAFSRVINKYSSSDPEQVVGESRSKFSTSSNNNLQLVVVGKKGWLYEDILKAPKKFGVEDKVKFLDFVSDEDLPFFYQNSICFVLPSLYEGFGLPILEAMKYGCPVITSNVSSLPEAGGDAAVYFDPQDTDDIAKNLRMVINDEKLRKEMIEKGYKQIKKFSWEKTAKETLKVLEEVARS